MKTTKITVLGYKHIHSNKSNKDFTVINYSFIPGDDTKGYSVGSLWVEGAHTPKLNSELEGLLGYDRRGNYGVVDII